MTPRDIPIRPDGSFTLPEPGVYSISVRPPTNLFRDDPVTVIGTDSASGETYTVDWNMAESDGLELVSEIMTGLCRQTRHPFPWTWDDGLICSSCGSAITVADLRRRGELEQAAELRHAVVDAGLRRQFEQFKPIGILERLATDQDLVASMEARNRIMVRRELMPHEACPPNVVPIRVRDSYFTNNGIPISSAWVGPPDVLRPSGPPDGP